MITDETLKVVRVEKPNKAVAAGAGGTAGTLAALVVARLGDLDPTAAVLVTGLLSSAFAAAGAYLRKVGPVIVRRIAPELDEA